MEEGFYERTLRVNIEKLRNVCYPDMPRESYKEEGFRCRVCLMSTGCGFQVTCGLDDVCIPGCVRREDGIPVCVDERSGFSAPRDAAWTYPCSRRGNGYRGLVDRGSVSFHAGG